MPTPRLPRIEAWSYSRYQTYNQCPAKAKFSIIERRKEPDSPSGEKGTRVHAIADIYATGKVPTKESSNAKFYPELVKTHKQLGGEIKKGPPPPIPVELETFKEEFADLRTRKCVAGSMWAFSREWNVTDWFSPLAWLRMKVDNYYLNETKNGVQRNSRLMIVDYKTGRVYDDHALQRSLYALGGFLQYPDVPEVEVQHWYLDAGLIQPDKPKIWKRTELPRLQSDWLGRTLALLNDTTFAPRPGDYCKYCHFRKANGGPCKF